MGFSIVSNDNRIVLTASRAEMSQFGPEIGIQPNGFTAFKCTFPRVFTTPFLKKYFKPADNADGSASFAPYSLRKVESILANHSCAEEIIVCHPDRLMEFVGQNTQIVGITTMDPLGLAYVSTTYNSLIGFGGESINSYEFKKLLCFIRRLKKKFGFKVVVGGEATWQIELAGLQTALGIDHMVSGPAEEELPTLMEKILTGSAPPVIKFKSLDYRKTQIPVIRAPAIYGDVEITRGCGRGCAFCSPNVGRKHSVPLQEIMKEVKINIEGGGRTIFTITDDMFLYESKPRFYPNKKAIVGLYESIANYPGVNHIHLSHASLAPVLADKQLLPQLAPILVDKSQRTLNGKKYATVEVGIESGSVGIMRKYMRGKAYPFPVEHWPEIVCEGISVFNEHKVYPLCTIIVGWPGETEKDSEKTQKLIENLYDQKAKMFYTPILFIPIKQTPLGKSKRISIHNLTKTQLDIIESCWEYNVEIWGSEIPDYWFKLIGFSAKIVGRWRRFIGADSFYIPSKLGNFLLKTKFPCDPKSCQ